MKKWSILLLLSFALILGCSALAIAASSPTAAPDDDPFFFEHNKALYPNWFVNGRTQPIFNNNTANYVKEDVFIEIPCDSDGDGKRDLVHAKITRISQTNSGFKSPVFMQVSPYRDGSPNVDPVRSHDVNIEQGINPDTTHYTYDTNIKTLIPRAADWPWTPEANAALNIPLPREATTVRNYGGNVGSAANDPGTGWYGYFVARGWAYAYLNCVGSLHAQGLSNCGGVEETLATISFAKWLNGEAKGFADPQCTIEYKPEWSNGKVSMGGTSYVGTLPIAAACSGYENITAVMPVEAISSWYDYYRDNGAVIAPGGYQGEDADELTDFIFSRRRTNLASYLPNNYPAEIAAIYWNHLAQITKDQDRATGDYNTFWDYRNYLATADRITAGVFIQQGTNDWNVKFKHFDQLWRAMDEKCPDTAKKAFIHLGTHTSVTSMYGSSHPGSSYMHALHLFLDHFQFGVDNGAESHDVIPNVNINNNRTGKVDSFETWPIAGADYRKFYLSPGSATQVGSLKNFAPIYTIEKFKDTIPRPTTNVTNYDNYVVSGGTAASGTTFRPLVPRSHSLSYYSELLTEDVRLNGAVKVNLTLAPDKAKGSISVALVELGTNARSYGTTTAGVPTDRNIPAATGVNAINMQTYSISGSSEYKIVTRGSVDVQNPNPSRKTFMDAGSQNFIPDYYFQTTAIVPGQAYNYCFTLEPMDYTFRAGQRIGIVVYSTDLRYTIIPTDVTAFDLLLGENSFVELPLKYNIERDAAGSEIDNGDAPVLNIVGDEVAVFTGPQEAKMSYSLDLPVGAFGFNLPYDDKYLTPTKVELFKNGNVPITLADGMFVVNPAAPGLIRTAFSADSNISGLTIVVTFDLAADIPANADFELDVDVLSVSAYDPLMSGLFPLDYEVTAGIISTVKLGDVNRDGSITPEDAMMLLQWYVGLIDLTKAQLLAADVNRDGVVDPIDASLILRMVVGG